MDSSFKIFHSRLCRNAPKKTNFSKEYSKSQRKEVQQKRGNLGQNFSLFRPKVYTYTPRGGKRKKRMEF